MKKVSMAKGDIGIPAWLTKKLGIQSEIVQQIDIQFKVGCFPAAQAKLMQSADESLKYDLENKVWMITDKVAPE